MSFTLTVLLWVTVVVLLQMKGCHSVHHNDTVPIQLMPSMGESNGGVNLNTIAIAS